VVDEDQKAIWSVVVGGDSDWSCDDAARQYVVVAAGAAKAPGPAPGRRGQEAATAEGFILPEAQGGRQGTVATRQPAVSPASSQPSALGIDRGSQGKVRSDTFDSSRRSGCASPGIHLSPEKFGAFPLQIRDVWLVLML
jgi:hypothetical protein